MAVRGLPPTKEQKETTTPLIDKTKEEKLITDFIRKGGSVSKAGKTLEGDPMKAMNVKLFQSELDRINAIREKIPKRDRPSIHDWILRAINEKLDRES
jgi:hypothetical protein